MRSLAELAATLDAPPQPLRSSAQGSSPSPSSSVAAAAPPLSAAPSHWICRICFAAFERRVSLHGHMLQHRQCGESECGFIGTQARVQDHAKQNHGTAAVVHKLCSEPDCVFAGTKGVVNAHVKARHDTTSSRLPPAPTISRGTHQFDSHIISGSSGNSKTRVCLACNKSFKAVRGLLKHQAKHVMCKHPGCGFVASSQALSKHTGVAHCTAYLPSAEPPSTAAAAAGSAATSDDSSQSGDNSALARTRVSLETPWRPQHRLNADQSADSTEHDHDPASRSTALLAPSLAVPTSHRCDLCNQSGHWSTECPRVLSAESDSDSDRDNGAATNWRLTPRASDLHARNGSNISMRRSTDDQLQAPRDHVWKRHHPAQYRPLRLLPRSGNPATTPAAPWANRTMSHSPMPAPSGIAMLSAWRRSSRESSSDSSSEETESDARELSDSSTDRAPAERLWECEACALSFCFQPQLVSHVATHVVCEFNGCGFSAGKRLVVQHAAAMHPLESAAAMLPVAPPATLPCVVSDEAGPKLERSSNCGATKNGAGKSSAATKSGKARRCTACNKSFNAAAILTQHKLEHVACSHPGCDFAALKRVVAQHTVNAHGSAQQTSVPSSSSHPVTASSAATTSTSCAAEPIESRAGNYVQVQDTSDDDVSNGDSNNVSITATSEAEEGKVEEIVVVLGQRYVLRSVDVDGKACMRLELE